jgi:hypothetical protein
MDFVWRLNWLRELTGSKKSWPIRRKTRNGKAALAGIVPQADPTASRKPGGSNRAGGYRQAIGRNTYQRDGYGKHVCEFHPLSRCIALCQALPVATGSPLSTLPFGQTAASSTRSHRAGNRAGAGLFVSVL